MTVCIAGICSWPYAGPRTVVAICDRMVTSVDVQFEPDQPKLVPFTSRIGALISGSGTTQAAICNAVKRRNEILEGWDDASLTVEEVANAFAQELAHYRARHAEQIYLRPLGLDIATFMASQNSYQSQFVQDTINNIQNFDVGDIQTIIMGLDQTGPHLFHVDKWGNIRCDDLIGFTAIGIGEWHATSHLMLAKYSKQLQFQSAILHMYLAKRKAEAAPGIGRTTDIFFITDNEITTLRDGIQDILKSCVDEMEAKIAPLTEETERKFRASVDAFLAEENQTPVEIEKGQPQINGVKDETPVSAEHNDAEGTTGA
jgi:20S proteasome alpha/beta subunit